MRAFTLSMPRPAPSPGVVDEWVKTARHVPGVGHYHPERHEVARTAPGFSMSASAATSAGEARATFMDPILRRATHEGCRDGPAQ